MIGLQSGSPLLLLALAAAASAISPALANDQIDEPRITLQYHGLPKSRRILPTPIKRSSLENASFLPASFGSVAVTPPRMTDTSAAVMKIAQAIPVFPGSSGCGLLTVHLPAVDRSLNSLDQNPARLEVKRLVKSPEFDEIDEPEQSGLLQGWTTLEEMYDALVSLASELATGMTSAINRVVQLETQACNLAQDYERIQPQLDRFVSTCRGTVPDDLYDWCISEQRRLRPEANLLRRGDEAMKAAVEEFATVHSKPLTDKNGTATQLYSEWQQRLEEHKAKVKAAIKKRNPKCRNTVNIHIQENGFPVHQPYQDAIPNAVDATAEDAVNYLNLVSDAFYLRRQGTKDADGIGAATAAGRHFLRSISTPPPAFRPALYFAPGPPQNKASKYRFDISISGRYPCTKQPVISMSTITRE